MHVCHKLYYIQVRCYDSHHYIILASWKASLIMPNLILAKISTYKIMCITILICIYRILLSWEKYKHSFCVAIHLPHHLIWSHVIINLLCFSCVSGGGANPWRYGRISESSHSRWAKGFHYMEDPASQTKHDHKGCLWVANIKTPVPCKCELFCLNL